MVINGCVSPSVRLVRVYPLLPLSTTPASPSAAKTRPEAAREARAPPRVSIHQNSTECASRQTEFCHHRQIFVARAWTRCALHHHHRTPERDAFDRPGDLMAAMKHCDETEELIKKERKNERMNDDNNKLSLSAASVIHYLSMCLSGPPHAMTTSTGWS
eukprot:GHVU01207870.1.p1 GENE.GHVU01207870.1~~GHVU01207870.1.p1  ORF type:complete len:159 (-),score=11.43 GHVU01207870.1:117-593(-)